MEQTFAIFKSMIASAACNKKTILFFSFKNLFLLILFRLSNVKLMFNVNHPLMFKHCHIVF